MPCARAAAATGAGGAPVVVLPSGEHHDHPGVARQRVKQLRSLSERVGMVGASAGGKRIHGVLELIHGGDELRIIRGIGGEAHHADAAA